jgi:hypothetical protein
VHLKSNVGNTVGHDLCPMTSQDFPCLNFTGGLQVYIIFLVKTHFVFCSFIFYVDNFHLHYFFRVLFLLRRSS